MKHKGGGKRASGAGSRRSSAARTASQRGATPSPVAAPTPAAGHAATTAPVDVDFSLDEDGLRLALELLWDGVAGGTGGEPDTLTVKRLPQDMPENGIGGHDALRRLAPTAFQGARDLSDAGYMAHMDSPTPWVTWAASMWSASRSQNLLHPDTAPAARLLERRVVDWFAPFYGMDGGHMVPGSTVANLTALWAARELKGIRRVVASKAAHISVRKAAKLLGLQYVELPVDANDRIMPETLNELHDAALVLTAGTSLMGSIDPLDVGVNAAWRHLDAAWAGPLRLSHRHSLLLDGVERMDSVSISMHKWLFQPTESALVMFRESSGAHAALTFGGSSGYLAQPSVGLLGSHGAAALPLAATLIAWGRRGLGQRIDHCMKLASDLDRLVRAEPSLQRLAPPITGIMLWRVRDVDSAAVRAHMQGAFVSKATHRDGTWLRSVAANPMADPERVVHSVLRAAAEVMAATTR